ncbi:MULTISPECIES: cell division protein SepF [unclassified Corynebacterium]|uniref:cell division protein SepF n=1 Tax=unclassified Corynebacterium TaxID=2624378 RepID=UPI0021AA9977|nr:MULTISPECIES: cell division protein SepF [unclassified Corynebacterium]MCT1451491.1 cell division protein SepF [Corynebacterium sp. p3-SID1145]MCT1460502.1 cell division protein SepF [Corynebacterium sp. p3-SID1140]MDN8593616.1 cell division protein SepF [Corynebacterium sp. P4_F2]WKK55741.1 cell division protein SepF [Corynebacterium sp. P4-C1]WKK63148.1 cell division protein SepF [Corynebacterium sp. P8-C1]
MSFSNSLKEFFGIGQYDPAVDPYYDDPAYEEAGTAAYSRSGAAVAEPRTRDRDYYEPRDYSAAIISVRPRNYNDAKEIGEPFRDGDAVVMDLSDVDKPTAMRLIDFAAGLCFAARGKMHKLSRTGDAHLVFAIVPENARTTVSELERAAHLR